MREGGKYQVQVSGYGAREATFLGRIRIIDVHIGDFVGVLFMGGYAFHLVRIDAIEQASGGVSIVFDWNGVRERILGGSLLADDVTVPIDSMCREVWRPDTDESCGGAS